MTIEDEISGRREALLELAGALGVPRESLAATENSTSLSGRATAAPETLGAIDQGRLDRWFVRLGKGLEIRCELRGDDGGAGPAAKLWEAKADSHARSSLLPVLDEAERYGRQVEVAFELKKGQLRDDLAQILGSTATAGPGDLQLVAFFFGEALQRILAALQGDYRSFEQEFLGAEDPDVRDRRLLVLVADLGGQLRGPYLAVQGADHLGEAAAYLASPASFDGLSKARELMRTECLWDDRPRLLAPEFFSLTAGDPVDLEPCQVALGRLRNQLTVPYLANWTVRSGEELVARFEADRSVRMDADGTSTKAFDLYNWVYGDPGTARTRLHLMRRVVASRLPPGERSFQEFVANAQDLMSECDLQLRMLMDENLGDSFEQRERIEKLVRDYVSEFAGQSASLSKEVVDNLYKTVGLLAGVALAYLLKPEQGITVLAVGVILYAAYILFILRFYLRSLEEGYRAKASAFDLENAELVRRGIVTSELEKRLASVGAEKLKLEGKFRTVRRIYRALLAAAAIVLLACWWVFVEGGETGATLRRGALGQHASRLKQCGYLDVRAGVEGWPAPVPVVGADGKAVLPDLTAIRKNDRQFVMLAWVPCAQIERPQELVELRALQSVAAEKRVELRLLTEALCGQEAGADRLRRWLGRQGPERKLSPP
jgi:hypothetical protein